MAAVLVTLAEAKDHLRITLPPGDPGDADLQAKLDEAEAIIRDYVDDDDPAWTPATVPPPIRAAIKLQLAGLVEDPGDDNTTEADLWLRIKRLLQPYHSPTLA